jgi:phosphate-selective porin OprO/OprP
MDAWSVQGSWIITGEQKLMKLLEPATPVDPTAGCWGCLELVARYSELDLDNDIFTGGYAAAGMWPGDTECTTIGLNWGLAKQIKLSLNYVHSEFEEEITIDGDPEDSEDAVLFGVQVVY